MNTCCLLLGGNIGDTKAYFSRAKEHLEKTVGPIELESSLYESPSWGFEAQQHFLNQCLIVRTHLKPNSLLNALKEIEAILGRSNKTTGIGYESRIIDIDILFIGDLIYSSDSLEIPHPRIHLRKFTLLPLNEVMPNYIHPSKKKSIHELLDLCQDSSTVIRLKDAL